MHKVISYNQLNAEVRKANIRPEKFLRAKKEGFGEWYLPLNIPNKGDYIYFKHKDPKQNKAAAASITYRGEEVCNLWHSNAKALRESYGLNLTDKHLTKGAIGFEKAKGHNLSITDIIYEDQAPIIGQYDRIEKLAQVIANMLGRKVHFVVASVGGGMRAYKEPKEMQIDKHSPRT